MVTVLARTFEGTGSRMSLAGRAAVFGLVLFCEKFLLNFLVDFDVAQTASGLGGVVRAIQHDGFRFMVAFAVSLALFAYARGEQRWALINSASRGTPVRLSWVALHVLLVLPLAPLSFYLFGRGYVLPFALLVALWVLFALGAVWALARALAPWAMWRDAARALGALALYAAVTAAVAAGAMQWSEKLWGPTAAITFEMVRYVLIPIIPSLQADAATRVLSSSHFAVQVSDVCSGLEGAGLLLAFCSAWLLCFRREYDFPRALILIPLGLALSFALNVLRIAGLMMIGDAGYPGIAQYGFHSQAGWIAFNCAAGLIAFASRRSVWLNRAAREERALQAELPATAAVSPGSRGATDAPEAALPRSDNPTAVYLLPFLLILAAGMIARAVSSGFEQLYVLRPIAAAAALVWGWPRLRALNWRCSWRGPLAGVAIFALWIAVARVLTVRAGMPAALAAMAPSWRLLWVVIRVAAAVLTVPLAEELAFRGYLMRRIVAADFESVRFRSVGVTALIVSAVAFGIGHGALWFPGVIAGLVYGLVLINTDRFGEAVAAHATTNALLAAYVLLWGQWQLW
ncbi:MAG: exosortase E/protease, VPEID-CTERM system [Steroidobacteraceae bacterium]